MQPKSRDTRRQAQLLLDALLESLVGVFALRLPDVRAAVKSQAPTMSLDSSYDGQHTILLASEIADACKLSGPEIQTTVTQIARAFTSAMWDTLVSHAHYENIATEPDIQFFRHLRNACGHDGTWNFKELKRPAQWRDKKLTLGHIGQPAFGEFFKHGDLALLIVDVDRKYFEQPTPRTGGGEA